MGDGDAPVCSVHMEEGGGNEGFGGEAQDDSALVEDVAEGKQVQGGASLEKSREVVWVRSHRGDGGENVEIL